MGCTTSAKVNPATKREQVGDRLNGDINRIIPSGRLSIAEAQNKRGEEIQEHLKRQSTQESNKVDGCSPKASSYSNIQILPEREHIFQGTPVRSNGDLQSKNGTSNEGTIVEKIEKDELEEEYEKDGKIMKTVETYELKVNPRSLTYAPNEMSDEEDNNDVKQLQRSSRDGTTDSTLTDTREIKGSVDSGQLRSNAKLLVNDIMNFAIHQIDMENKQHDSTSVTMDNSNYVDERAKQVVNNILGNAMLIVKNETNSD